MSVPPPITLFPASSGRGGTWALLPGILLSSAVACAGLVAAWTILTVFPVPALVIALFVGIALHSLAEQPQYQPGITFCARSVLRVGIALLGLRTAVTDITSLGGSTIMLVLSAMLLTIASSFAFARLFGQDKNYAALVGVGTAVCGASAALAVSAVLPDYARKKADTLLVVVVLNTFATIAMLAYPQLCMILGFDAHSTGVMLGATIHDVAQVAGSVYPFSDTTANTAIIVKLFRVFVLFPLVVVVGWSVSRAKVLEGAAAVPVPVFALAFILLAMFNTLLPMVPLIAPAYIAVRPALIEIANFALLLAIAALGLSTSLRAMLSVGWRHFATLLASTTMILGFVTAGLMVMAKL